MTKREKRYHAYKNNKQFVVESKGKGKQRSYTIIPFERIIIERPRRNGKPMSCSNMPYQAIADPCREIWVNEIQHLNLTRNND
jgi:hypothetical protein